jgi:solute carrier family 6 amino acid transporter-like protein 5/7/9/14
MDIVGTLGGDFIVYFMVLVQTVGICLIYGFDRFIRDIEFMLGIKLGAYWKLA